MCLPYFQEKVHGEQQEDELHHEDQPVLLSDNPVQIWDLYLADLSLYSSIPYKIKSFPVIIFDKLTLYLQ